MDFILDFRNESPPREVTEARDCAGTNPSFVVFLSFLASSVIAGYEPT